MTEAIIFVLSKTSWRLLEDHQDICLLEKFAELAIGHMCLYRTKPFLTSGYLAIENLLKVVHVQEGGKYFQTRDIMKLEWGPRNDGL